MVLVGIEHAKLKSWEIMKFVTIRIRQHLNS